MRAAKHRQKTRESLAICSQGILMRKNRLTSMLAMVQTDTQHQRFHQALESGAVLQHPNAAQNRGL